MIINKSETPVASVVVPAYKSKNTIIGCLSALMAQETDLPYEITVVESSGDGTAEIVREQFPMVRLLESKERLFPGAARNWGAEKSRGELLLFIDSDCLSEPDWISRMWQAHHDRECAAVAGAILNANPDSPISTSSYMSEFNEFFPCGEPRYVEYLPSGNLSYKVDVFWKYGGFDPKEPMYEDLIFNKLLYRASEKLLFDPSIQVAHSHRTGLMEYLSHEFRRGKAAAASRRRGLLLGISYIRHPILALLAAPGLFMRKAVVFPYRFMRAYPSDASKLAHAMPYLYMALVSWHLGLFVDVVKNRPTRRTQESRRMN